MRTKIYYFSGTGNSLFIAQKLQESLEHSELIPIIGALKRSNKKIDAEKVVLVFPIYALTIPLPVQDFLKLFDFSGVQYFSAIATRLGIYFDDFKRIDKLIRPCKLNAHFIFNMGSNDVKVKNYKCPLENETKALATTNLKELVKIAQIINNNEDSREKDSNYLEALPFGDIRAKFIGWMVPKLMLFSKVIGGVNYFYINTNCNGCGICSKVCLSGKISMQKEQPIWHKKTLCHMCYACINFCPTKAIEIDSIPGVPSYSYENERYNHPFAGIEEIQNQKSEVPNTLSS